MPAIKYINRLKAIDQLIKLKATGSPKELADKLGISERQIYKYISDLKVLGSKIQFDKFCNSYTYLTNGDLSIEF